MKMNYDRETDSSNLFPEDASYLQSSIESWVRDSSYNLRDDSSSIDVNKDLSLSGESGTVSIDTVQTVPIDKNVQFGENTVYDYNLDDVTLDSLVESMTLPNTTSNAASTATDLLNESGTSVVDPMDTTVETFATFVKPPAPKPKNFRPFYKTVRELQQAVDPLQQASTVHDDDDLTEDISSHLDLSSMFEMESHDKTSMSTLHSRLQTSTIAPKDGIAALSVGQGRQRCEVGIAYIHHESMHLKLTELVDTACYSNVQSKLNILVPSIIIAEPTVQKHPIYEIIKTHFPEIGFTFTNTRFDETKGIEWLNKYAANGSRYLQSEIVKRRHALRAIAGLSYYITTRGGTSLDLKSVFTSFSSGTQIAAINRRTAVLLELLDSNIQSNTKKEQKTQLSLYSFLNKCSTSAGKKHLKATILSPSTSPEQIAKRHETLKELASNDELNFGLQTFFGTFKCDLEKSLSVLVRCNLASSRSVQRTEQIIATAIEFIDVLNVVPKLRKILELSESEILVDIKALLSNLQFEHIKQQLEAKIASDITLAGVGSLRRKENLTWALKHNIDCGIDLRRAVVAQLTKQIEQITTQLGQKYRLPIRANYTIGRGWHMVVTKRQVPGAIPAEFTKVRGTKVNYFFTTDKVDQITCRIKVIQDEIFVISSEHISPLLSIIRNNMELFYQLADSITYLDVLFAFYMVGTGENWTFPEITDHTDVKNMYNPLMKRVKRNVVSNDIRLTTDKRGMFITGPNMAGKSTYLISFAVAQILCQIGCTVPADAGSKFALFSEIRLVAPGQEAPEDNRLKLQEREFIQIYDTVECDKLFLIDELLKGASDDLEAVGMLWALIEKLCQKNANFLFTTHFPDLKKIVTEKLPMLWGVFEARYTFRGKESKSRQVISYDYKLIVKDENETEKSDSYGIELMKTLNWPDGFVESVLAHQESLKTYKQQEVYAFATPANFYSKAVKVISQAGKTKDLEEIKKLQQRASKFVQDFGESTMNSTKMSINDTTLFSDTMSVRRKRE